MPSLDEALAVAIKGKDYKFIRRLEGGVKLEADAKVDHGFVVDALDRIGRLDQEPHY